MLVAGHVGLSVYACLLQMHLKHTVGYTYTNTVRKSPLRARRSRMQVRKVRAHAAEVASASARNPQRACAATRYIAFTPNIGMQHAHVRMCASIYLCYLLFYIMQLVWVCRDR